MKTFPKIITLLLISALIAQALYKSYWRFSQGEWLMGAAGVAVAFIFLSATIAIWIAAVASKKKAERQAATAEINGLPDESQYIN